MEKGAFFVAALPVFDIEIALRHFFHIIFMKKFTVVSFLTQPTKPMFTYNSLVSPDMPQRTELPSCASV